MKSRLISRSSQRQNCIKSWQIIADNLSKAGWSYGYVSALDCEGRTIWIVDAHRDNGKRFIVRADEILTAFIELERITRESSCVRESFLLPNKFQDPTIGLEEEKKVNGDR